MRAYDPTLGRFLSRDPLGRAPLFVARNPYVYAGNNPLSNVDPSGQYRAASAGSVQRESSSRTNRMMARIAKKRGCDKACQAQRQQEALAARLGRARAIARAARDFFADQVNFSGPTNPAAPSEDIIQEFFDFYVQYFSALVLGGLFAASGALWTGVGGAFLAYKLVALFAEVAFVRELTMNDAFWLNAQSIDSFRAWSLGTVEVIATVIFCALLPFTLETALPLLIGIEVGLAAGMVEVWTQMSKYFNEEKQVFGYPQGD